MTIGFQYNELDILKKVFPDMDSGTPIQRNGYVVEIGAADGIDNSNSHELINNYGWSGLLVEPHPGYFMDLLKLYSNNPKVQLSNYAITDYVGRLQLWLDDQCSSLVYKKSRGIEVQCITLKLLFELYKTPKVNFLSIDCEGVDMEVLYSLDWNKYKPDLICIEHSMSREKLDNCMKVMGYKEFDRNMGNTFFVPKS